MKNIKFKFLLKTAYTTIFIISTLISCVKNTNTTEVISESEAILAVKKIVGEKGTLTVLSNNSNTAKQSMEIKEDPVTLLNINEFQVAFNSLSIDSNSVTAVLLESPIDSNSQIESYSFKSMDEEDGPKTPGLYRFSFLPKNGGNSSYFSTMNLSYNAGANGEIIGAPSLYFSGLHLFNWQPAQTSFISFDKNTFTSTFAITGTTTFGIQLGGITIGWSSNITFYITIINDELNLTPVRIYSKN